jgi:hypothetical protein
MKSACPKDRLLIVITGISVKLAQTDNTESLRSKDGFRWGLVGSRTPNRQVRPNTVRIQRSCSMKTLQTV